jgi:glycosyltransferase involved in cell wall biosynthesis
MSEAISAAQIVVCVCTHDPRRDVLRRCFEAIAAQRDAPGLHVLVVDNASQPPIGAAETAPLAAAGLAVRVVREERLGNVHARARAIAETDSPWVLFVDDDNEIAPDYVANGMRAIAANPALGSFGGRLVLPPGVGVPRWLRPLLPFIAIRDCGDARVARCEARYGPWIPPTAGAFVRRPVLERYRARVAGDPAVASLGRKGRRGLGSCEDTLMMYGGCALGYESGYEPDLRLVHHLDPRRFTFGYMVRLMYGYGRSLVQLERVTASERGGMASGAPTPALAGAAPRRQAWLARKLSRGTQAARYALPYAACLMALQLGMARERRAQRA